MDDALGIYVPTEGSELECPKMDKYCLFAKIANSFFVGAIRNALSTLRREAISAVHFSIPLGALFPYPGDLSLHEFEQDTE